MLVNNTAEAKQDEDLKKASAFINSDIFKLFLKPNIDRCSFIDQWLKANLIPHSIVNLASKKHIIIKFAPHSYNPNFKQRTIVAHYDREKNTEGANDNSAACFQLMLFAKYLQTVQFTHNIKIIFTDGEEAGAKGISKQGSFSLGYGLKKLNMHKDDIFVFDMCGRGDTLILSQSGIYGRPSHKTKPLGELHSLCCKYAKEACPEQWFSLLTAYSDNAGFIASGLNAQVITVLPKNEAELLLRYLADSNKNKDEQKILIDFIIKNKKPEKNSIFEKIIPQSWQYMHTEKDCLKTLTPSSFILIEKYLKVLAKNCVVDL